MSFLASGILEGLGKAMSGLSENNRENQLLKKKALSEVGIFGDGKTQDPDYLKAYENIQGAKADSSLSSLLAVLGGVLGGGKVPTANVTGNNVVQPMTAPNVGDIVDGYKFLGGDPSDPNSWSK